MNLNLADHGHVARSLDDRIYKHIGRAIVHTEVGLHVTVALSHFKAGVNSIPRHLGLRELARAAHNHGAQRVSKLRSVGPRKILAGRIVHFDLRREFITRRIRRTHEITRTCMRGSALTGPMAMSIASCGYLWRSAGFSRNVASGNSSSHNLALNERSIFLLTI